MMDLRAEMEGINWDVLALKHNLVGACHMGLQER